MQTRGHRESGWAAEPGGPAGYTVTPRGRLLAEATACPSQLNFIPLHPGENQPSPCSAWGPCRCRKLKAAGREECGAEAGR